MNRQEAARVDGAGDKCQRESKMPVSVGRAFASGQFSDIVNWHDIALHR